VPTPAAFIRGDANANETLDLSDALGILSHLFQGDQALSCPDAADADDSGAVEVTDAIRILTYLFLGGGAPAQPFPAPGHDGTLDQLMCPSPSLLEPDGPVSTQEAEAWLNAELEPLMLPTEGIEVDPDLFQQLSSLPPGSSLAELADSSGMAEFLVSVRAAQATCPSEPVACVWAFTVDIVPQRVEQYLRGIEYDQDGKIRHHWRRPEDIQLGGSPVYIAHKTQGPGPQHLLVAQRVNPECSTPVTESYQSAYGYITINLNLFCFDRDLTRSQACKATGQAEGAYEGVARVHADAGQKCGLFDEPGQVEVVAQEEARLQATGATLFDKAIAVQRGNHITRAVTFSLNAGLGVGSRGAAADVGVSIGHSVHSVDRTGSAEGLLSAFGSARVELPVTVRLEAQGLAGLRASKRANGFAAAATRAASVCLAATASCPCAVTGFELGFLFGGRGDARERLQRQAENFFFTRTGRRAFNWIPF
jgi:hypothetical protein